MAHVFGGPASPSNLVPLPTDMNQEMQVYEVAIRNELRQGRQILYTVRVNRGGDISYTSRQAEEAAHLAGWSNPEDIPDFPGRESAPDNIPSRVSLTAKVEGDCRRGLPPSNLPPSASASPKHGQPDARMRSAVSANFRSLLQK